MDKILDIAKRIKAMADTGLLFTKDAYDKERYQELLQISNELFQISSGEELAVIENYFSATTDYPTPKVDVRGFLLNDKNEVLLVQEKSDKKWTIPGGWCEIGLTPKENIKKEMLEETGLQVEVGDLLAVFDKKCYPHPPQPHYVYKLIYKCKPTNGVELNPNFEILDAKFISMDQLPELSTDRILEEQLHLLFEKVKAREGFTYSD